MLHRRPPSMGAINDPSFSCQIRKSSVPICPFPETIIRVAGYQAPMDSMKIEPGVLVHNSILHAIVSPNIDFFRKIFCPSAKP
jgi:hypothetical protein